MDEMIERVAHAMEQAMVHATPDKAQCSRDMSLILARAAIDAMRYPTVILENCTFDTEADAPKPEAKLDQ